MRYINVLRGIFGLIIFCSIVKAEEKPWMKEYKPDKHTILLLHLNEGEGTHVYDSSFFENHPWSLILETKTVSWTKGKFGKAIQFTPSTTIKPYLYGSGIVIKGTTPSLNPKKEITVEFWAKAKDWKSSTQVMISKYRQFDINTHPDGIYFRLYQRGKEKTQYLVPHNLANNTWHHFALVYDGKTTKFFIDGELKKCVEEEGELAGADKNYPSITIGCERNGTYPFNGVIDEVRISDIARKEFKVISKKEPIEELKKNVITANAIYLKDLSKFTPSEYISTSDSYGKWWLRDIDGKKVLWASDKFPHPPLTYPLSLKGWYDIYVGLYTYPYPVDYEDTMGIHIKLTKDKWYTHICGGRNGLGWGQGCFDEIYWKRANLTGEDIILFEPYGKEFKPAGGISYIKLVPISMERVKEDEKKKKEVILNSGQKDVGGMADFESWVYMTQGIEKEDTKRVIDNHKNAGFNIIFFMVNAGGYVDYHSKIGEWFNYKRSGDPRRKTKACEDILYKQDPLKVASEYAHKIGVKLFAWFRITNEATWPNRYMEKYKDLKVWGPDGPFGNHPSLAYKEIRNYKLSLLKEIVTNYNVDGILIDYQRDMPVIGYEPPVVNAYIKKYGVDPRVNVSERRNMRWKRFRAGYITEFMKDLKEIVSEEEQKSGRKIEIAARVCARDNLWKGLDVERWIKEGLIDIVIPSNRAWFDPIIPVKPFIEMAKGTKCKVYPCINPFFAGGADIPSSGKEYLQEIIRKRLEQGATPLEYAQKVLEHYSNGADGVVFYESEYLTMKNDLIPFFRTLSNPKKVLSYINNYEKYEKEYREWVKKNSKIELNLKDGQTISGKVDIIANVSGFTPSQVDFYIDGKKVSTEYGDPYWCFGDGEKWDTTKVKNGIHKIKAVAIGEFGEVSTSIKVKVKN